MHASILLLCVVLASASPSPTPAELGAVEGESAKLTPLLVRWLGDYPA